MTLKRVERSESESRSVMPNTLELCMTIQSMEFSRPEYWSRQPFPSPGDHPKPRIKPRSPTLLVDSLPAEPQGKPFIYVYINIFDISDTYISNMGIYFFCWVMQVFELTILNVNYKTLSSIIFRWRMPKNLVGQQSQ